MTHEVAIALPRRAASFVQRPHHQALAPAAVSRRKHTWQAGSELARVSFDITAGIPLHPQRIEERLFRPQESHGQHHNLGGQHFFGAGDRLRNKLALFVFAPLHLHGVDCADVALGIALKFCSRGEINAGIGTKFSGGFFLAIVHLVDLGPFGPGIVRRATQGRLGHNFHLDQAGAAVAQGGAHAVGAGVAAANNHHIFARVLKSGPGLGPKPLWYWR